MKMEVEVGKMYRHFKGDYYRVLCIANDSENQVNGEPKQLVIYESLYGNHLVWARPIELFTSKVDKKKYPDSVQEYRFEKVNEDI